VEIVYTDEPAWDLWGPSEYIKYDAENHVYIDKSWQHETLWWYLDAEMKDKLGEIKVPVKKNIVFSLRSDYYELEYYVFFGVIYNGKRIKPFFIHCAQDAEYDERFDTVMMPNGSIAALNTITEDLREKYGFLDSGLAIDESYPSSSARGKEREFILRFLCEEIENALAKGNEPVVFCTVLSYNAEGSLNLLRELKDKFGDRVRTGVGGQLIRVSPETYCALPYIDHVGVGDAEVILGSLLIEAKPYAESYLKLDSAQGIHYASFSYENYIGLNERLEEMSQYQFGPFSGFRQLITESVRGCAWAHATRQICEMCALQSIDDAPEFKPFKEHFRIENQLAQRFNINWIFDVSNQFIPVVGIEKQEQWLADYVEAHRRYSDYEIDKYVYLTTNSISENTAPLIREAGIRVAYIGIDGWDQATLKALHKTRTDARKALQLCRENELYVRASLVIGAGLNEQNIQTLPQFVGDVMEGFGDVILSWGNFLQIILPGSPAWYKLRDQASQQNWNEVAELYQFFDTNGFLNWQQQELMTQLYIQHLQGVDYEAVVEARDQARSIVSKSINTIPITIQDGGHLEKT